MDHKFIKYSFNSLFSTLIKLIKKASLLKEVPVAALIFDPKSKKIISKAHNLNNKLKDPLAHAEILAIKLASKKLSTKRLDGYDLYCTLEPCLMCSAVIFQSKIRRVYFCSEDKKGGALINNQKLIFDRKILNKPRIYYGFKEKIVTKILKDFFKKMRVKKVKKDQRLN